MLLLVNIIYYCIVNKNPLFLIDGVPAASISVSSLGSQSSQSISVPLNITALIEYENQLNIQANIRDYLISFTTNLVIVTANNIQIQASSLAQLTQSTNQLTRTTAVSIFD
jgi:type III secretory pathway lipoprotein EscJ